MHKVSVMISSLLSMMWMGIENGQNYREPQVPKVEMILQWIPMGIFLLQGILAAILMDRQMQVMTIYLLPSMMPVGIRNGQKSWEHPGLI